MVRVLGGKTFNLSFRTEWGIWIWKNLLGKATSRFSDEPWTANIRNFNPKNNRCL